MKLYKSRKAKQSSASLSTWRRSSKWMLPPCFCFPGTASPRLSYGNGVIPGVTMPGEVLLILGGDGGVVVGRKTKLSEIVWPAPHKEGSPHSNTYRTLLRMLEVNVKTNRPSLSPAWPIHSLSREERIRSSQTPEMGKNIRRGPAWPKDLWGVIGVLMAERSAQGRLQG